MKDYEELYYEYRSKYRNACQEINACDRQIASLETQKRNKTNRINALNTSNRKLRDAISDLKTVIGREDNVSDKLGKVTKKMDSASANFSGMVKSSGMTNKSLKEVFAEESKSTKTKIQGVFDTVKRRKRDLEERLERQERELKQAKEDLASIKRQLRNEEAERRDWKYKKRNYNYNMEYYKRKMQQEGY